MCRIHRLLLFYFYFFWEARGCLNVFLGGFRVGCATFEGVTNKYMYIHLCIYNANSYQAISNSDCDFLFAFQIEIEIEIVLRKVTRFKWVLCANHGIRHDRDDDCGHQELRTGHVQHTFWFNN